MGADNTFGETNFNPEKEEMYYIQNGWVGNAMCWWGIDGKGYTTDITKAGKYTKEQAFNQVKCERGSEYAWPCDHVDKAKKIPILHNSALNDELKVTADKINQQSNETNP